MNKTENSFDKSWSRWIMQTALSWDDLSDIVKKTGIDVIDNDHRILTEYIIEFNDLLDMIHSEGFNLRYINQQKSLFEKLYDYSAKHFEREERLINRYSLDGGKYQNKQHLLFLEMIQTYIAEFASGKLNVSMDMKLTILNWWVNHINTIDYNTFCMENWAPKVLATAANWNDVRFLIRSIGIDSVDEQHRIMTEQALDISQSVNESNSNLNLEVFKNLHDYAEMHFQHEEELIEKFHLTGKKIQLERHRYFLDLMDSYHVKLQKKELDLSHKLRNSIMEWWINHINQEDYQTFCSKQWIVEAIHNSSQWNEISQLVRVTGISSIDEQHKNQAEMILELHELINRIKNQDGVYTSYEELSDKLIKIYEYAAEHFQHEETIMQEMKLYNLKQHRQEHKDLLNKIQDHIDHALAGRLVLSDSLKDLLLNWWVQHINDIDYKSFVAAPETEFQAL